MTTVDLTIPGPPWATHTDPWEWSEPGRAWRCSEHRLTDPCRPFCVSITATDHYDRGVLTPGRVRVQLDLPHETTDMSACDARDLAGQLVEAATLCDWANGLEPDKKPTD